MKIESWAGSLLATAPFLAGCGDFWQAPSCTNCTTNSGFSLSNSGAITVSPGATTGDTSTITVTPANSFTGTVTLSCAVTTAPSGATSPTTCGVSPASVAISSTAAQTATLTATSTASTTLGIYEITVSGASGGVTETTTVCVDVTTSGTGTCGSAATTSGNFYVVNQATNQVVAMNISSGTLTTIGAITVPTPLPLAIAVAPNGNFLYVSTSRGVYLYTIGSNGALTLENNLPMLPDQAVAMQVDATNSWLVDAVLGLTQAQVFAIAINPNTGQLASVNESEQPFNLPAPSVKQLVISPNDSSSCANCYVFVAMGNGGTEAIHFNPSPANGNPFGGAGNPGLLSSLSGDSAVAVDPRNRFLYIGESVAVSGTQTGGLRVFSIAAGGITPVGSPYATGGTGPTAIQPSLDGNYVYVANGSVSGSSTGNISSFSVSSSGLTLIGTVAAGSSGQLGLAEDSTGSYLLAVDFTGNPDLEAYTMSSGTLTSALTGATGSGAVGATAIVAAPK
jgi:6-phosphogluconolactonase (cycloisomerase 2 family)